MRRSLAAIAVAFFTIFASVAWAAPAVVSVRIEGKAATLFEGPVLTDGHGVWALGDTKAPPEGRRCDGLNNGAHSTPGPTPTAASVDAMHIVGQGFDGDWYAEPFEDFFITQWGPDRQSVAGAAYWGLAVNNVFTNVGGCQQRVGEGDEVLWVYDAFNSRPRLALYPGDYDGGAVQLTAEAELGAPFEVEVNVWDAVGESAPPGSPPRSTEAFEGAEVAPATVGPGGFERVDTGSPEAVETDEDGLASIVFDDPGWHRIKATALAPGGGESVVRSNRLDVCVPEPAAEDCGAPPPDDLTRVPLWVPIEKGQTIPDPLPVTESARPNPFLHTRPGAAAGRVSVQLQRLDRRRIARGLLGVSWRVLDPGVGIGRWTISSQRVGARGARFVTRAAGREKTSAQLRLPFGASYRLRIEIADLLGRSSAAMLGRVTVPG